MKIDTREIREEFDRQRGTPPADSKRYRMRHPLDILAGVIAETTKVYRKMRNEKLDHDKGRTLVWVLSQRRAMVVPYIEARHGYARTNRSYSAAH